MTDQASKKKAWNNLRYRVLSKGSQLEKAPYYMIPIIWHYEKGKTVETVGTSLVVQRLKEFACKCTQGWFLVWEDATCHRASKPVRHNWGPWTVTTAAGCPTGRTPHGESSPLSTAGEACAPQPPTSTAKYMKPCFKKRMTSWHLWQRGRVQSALCWNRQIRVWSLIHGI